MFDGPIGRSFLIREKEFRAGRVFVAQQKRNGHQNVFENRWIVETVGGDNVIEWSNVEGGFQKYTPGETHHIDVFAGY